jgi:GGDEF domain-containing protein
VIAIDLNGLKIINDEQGHAAGDAMLRRAGEVLAKAVDSALRARVAATNSSCCCRGMSAAPWRRRSASNKWWK